MRQRQRCNKPAHRGGDAGSAEPSPHIAGGQSSRSAILDGDIPSWAKDVKIRYSTINARAEMVDTMLSFRVAFRRRRCLIPATGCNYEWQATKNGKQPWRLVPTDGGLFGFAGLWEHWEDRSGTGETIESFSIIVTEANEMAHPIHDRMPVIVDPAHFEVWLGATDTAIPLAMLQPYPAEGMRVYPVSKRGGSPRNDDPDLIEPITGSDRLL